MARPTLYTVQANYEIPRGDWCAHGQVPTFYVAASSENEARLKALDVLGVGADNEARFTVATVLYYDTAIVSCIGCGTNPDDWPDDWED